MKKLLSITICVGLCMSVAYQYACKNKSTILIAPDQEAQSSKPEPIHLENGQEFSITLKGNSSTGFSWQIKSLNDEYIRFLGTTTTLDQPTLMASGEANEFHFKALKKGTTELVLMYSRPWEKEPVEVVTHTIEIE